MNELTVFTNEQFGSLRTLELNGYPWFVGKDVEGVPNRDPLSGTRTVVEILTAMLAKRINSTTKRR